MLDFDLHLQAAVSSDLDLSGENVVEAVIRNMDTSLPVLIHSMNPSGTPLMLRKLKEAGFKVLRIPWHDLEKETLLKWLSDVRGNWENLWGE